MEKLSKQKVWQAAACLACVGLLWISLEGELGHSEFSGGSLTGKLFAMADFGFLFFLVALLLTIFHPRVAAALVLAATLLCLPFYFYILMPGPYRRMFKGEYSVPLERPFVWDNWAVVGVLSLVIAAFLSLHSFSKERLTRKASKNMKSAARTFLVVLLISPCLLGQSKRGTVCVAPNSPERPKVSSPGDDYNPATLSIGIDKRPPIPWPHKEGVKIDDLDVGERHLVVLTSDGKKIKSFWLRFKDYETPDSCISFDGYQGVHVDDQRSSPRCKCK
jgi:hypothetical protein